MTTTAILDLQDAGFSRHQIEALARLFETQAATKSDIGSLKLDINSVEVKLAQTKADLEARIAETKADLEVKIAENKADLVRWVVGVGFAQVLTLVGTLFAFVKMFPGAHP